MNDRVQRLMDRVSGETILTRAIEAGDYNKAMKEISAHGNEEYLNDGPDRYSPLHMVLEAGREKIIHLCLAKSLIEHGANPNLQYSLLSCGLGRRLFTKTPFQMLFFIYPRWKMYRAHALPVIGMDGQQIDQEENFKEQTEELIRLFISYGADVNANYKTGTTIIHALVDKAPCDIKLVRLLCEAGAEVNVKHHTHLPLLCAPSVVSFCGPLHSIMCHGDFTTARELIQYGAETGTRATAAVSLSNLELSPLMFFLIRQGHHSYYDQNQKYKEKYNQLSPLIDNGFFDNSCIETELNEQLERFPEFAGCMDVENLVGKLFGHFTSDLQQLCVRELAKYICLDNASASELQQLVVDLYLPRSLVNRLYLEAFKFQMPPKLVKMLGISTQILDVHKRMCHDDA